MKNLSELSLSDLVALEHILSGAMVAAKKLNDGKRYDDLEAKFYTVLGEQIDRLSQINFNN